MATVVAAAAAGGAFAAEASSSTNVLLRACDTSKGRLALTNSAGHCPHGDHAVSINRQGLRGATGKTGKTGRAGQNGVGATSAAMDLSQAGTFGTQNPKPETVGSFAGYTITLTCDSGQTQLEFVGTATTKILYLHGSFDGSGENYVITGDGTPSEYANGYNAIRTEIAAGTPNTTVVADGAYDWSTGSAAYSDGSANILLLSGASTATLDFYLYSTYAAQDGTYQSHCQADGQLTPSATEGG